MVILGKGEERQGPELMGMASERSNPLHNFTVPPWLKWGSRKVMRCMKVNSIGEVSAVDHRKPSERSLIGRFRDSELDLGKSSDRKRKNFKFSPSPAPAEEVGVSERKRKREREHDNGIDAVREKLMFDLQTEADKMKDAILREGLEDEQPPPANSSAANDTVMPWNLRTRRAACKAPTNGISCAGGGSGGGGGKSFQVDVPQPIFPSLRTETKSHRFLRGNAIADAAASPSGEKRERAKFSLSLSRQEIEKDFLAMTGHRLPRRPKKRAKNVQKQLDTLFPGLWLTEVHADFYKVPDAPETRT